MALKETIFLLLFVMLPLATKTEEHELESSGEFATSILPTSTPMIEASNMDTDICPSEEIKEELERIRKRLKELLAKTETCRGCCPTGWVRQGRSCYYIDDTPTAIWSDARQTCESMGADLVVIRSAKENDFIFDLVKKQKRITWYGAWLGLLRGADSKFYWVDGTPLEGKYSAWNTGEPNNRKEHCGHMWGPTRQRPGKWNDVFCDLRAYERFGRRSPVVVCQKPSLEAETLGRL